jgi:5-methylcytosine-specific restriction endonuclease McrA
LCLRCGCNSPDSFYRKNKSRCKKCLIADTAEWQKRNREKVRASHAKYRERLGHAVNARIKEWRQSNPDKAKAIRRRYSEKHADVETKAKAAWKAANKPRIAEYTRRRVTLKRGGEAESVAQFYEFVRGAAVIRCYWCKRRVPKEERHIDHVIPLAKGGSHTAANLCCSCATCNLSKGAKMPEEFSGQAVLKF